MKINNIIILAISTFILTSCNDWLDVSPKSQIMEEDQFCREGGYRDELTGVYTVMESAKLYVLPRCSHTIITLMPTVPNGDI